MEAETRISPEQLRRVIALLKATFTHLIIDVSKSYSELDLAAMQSSDVVLLISQLDLPCLRNVVRLMQFFETVEELSEKVRVVVNRLGLEDSQISLNKALETIGREVYWQIPNDYATIVESRNNGIPLVTQAPRAKITKAIELLAKNLGQLIDSKDESVVEKKQRKGLFRFLSGSAK